MPNYNSREQLRRVYQQTDEGDKTFIPAKPKVDLYGEQKIAIFDLKRAEIARREDTWIHFRECR